MIARLFPLFVLLVALGLFFGYINPTWTGSIAATSAEVASFDRAITAAHSYQQKENELIAKQNSIPEEDRARVKAFLPDGVDNVQLILDLDSLAKRSGIELSNFETNTSDKTKSNSTDESGALALEDAKASPAGTITFSMTATGTYQSFRVFLEGVEKSLRPLDLIDLSIKTSQTGIYTYDMTFVIYWLR